MWWIQFSARRVEDALQCIFQGGVKGRNRTLGQPGLWRVAGKGSREDNKCPQTIVFLTYAFLEVPLDHPSSELIINL